MPDAAEDILARRAISIAEALAHASPGEKAEARRMDGNGAPVYWRQVARLGIGQAQEAQWLCFTKLVSLLTPTSRDASVHESKRAFGAVLADGGDRTKPLNTPDAKPFLSEARLARLIAARGEAQLEALERVIRMLSRQSPTLNVVHLAEFLFGRSHREPQASYYKRIDHTVAEEAVK